MTAALPLCWVSGQVLRLAFLDLPRKNGTELDLFFLSAVGV